MSKIRFTLSAIGLMMLILAAASSAQAQATRTWVSGVGDDVNPCSRTAPCKTFAGAISKTAAGGEIDCLDPGGIDTTRAGISFEGTNALNDAFSVNNSNITRCSNGVRISNRASGTVSNSVISINNSTGTSAGVVITTAVSAGGIVDLEGCEVNFNSVGIQPNANNAIRLSAVHMTGNGNALNFNGGTIGTWNNNHIIGNAAGENFAAMTDILEQ